SAHRARQATAHRNFFRTAGTSSITRWEGLMCVASTWVNWAARCREGCSMPTLPPCVLGITLYVHQGTLMAQRFSLPRLELEGEPAPVAEHVTSGTRANVAALSGSAAGTIAYRTGSPGGKRQFVWFDRKGREVAKLGSRHGFGPSYASISPDGRRL